MNAEDTTIKHLLGAQSQYRIPIFQRSFAWGADDRETLWNDILELYEMRRIDDPNAQHFMASIVTSVEEAQAQRPTAYIVIDGQQRLTTLSTLFAALRDVAKEQNPELAEQIHNLYLTNPHASHADDKSKLVPTTVDREEWDSILYDGDVGGSPQLRATYDEFVGRIDSERDEDGEPLDLSFLLDSLLNGLSVVSVTLDEKDNAFRVFESLNATGLQLKQVDLLRNLFMMKLPADSAEKAFHEFWEPMQNALGEDLQPFAHDYYLKFGQFIREDAIYSTTKRQLANANEVAVFEALADLKWHSQLWLRIDGRAASHGGETDGALRDALQSLNCFGTETPWPFLLNLYAAYQRDERPGGPADLPELSAAEFAGIVSEIESFLVRRMFAARRTNALNRMLIRLWDQLPKDGSLLEETRLLLRDPDRRRPDDQEFRAALLEYPLYLDSRPNQRRLILDKMAMAIAGKEPVDLSATNIQIEHIVPQTLTDAWRTMLGEAADDLHEHWQHRLGNLTLTAYNPEISNGPWVDPDDPSRGKRVFYAASNIAMTREVAENDVFGEAQLKARADRLADLAMQIWP
jgi:hypothetical protein